jgi:hypothetical protein
LKRSGKEPVDCEAVNNLISYSAIPAQSDFC